MIKKNRQYGILILACISIVGCGGGSGATVNSTSGETTAELMQPQDDAEVESNVGVGVDVDTGAQDVADSDVDAGTDVGAGSEVETGTEVGADTDVDTVVDTDAEVDTEVDVDSEIDTNPGGEGNELTDDDLTIYHWHRDINSAGLRPYRYRFNGAGQMGGLASKVSQTALFTGEPGTVSTVILEGDVLPGDTPSTVISKFDDETLGFGADGTVAVVVNLKGARPGRALIAGKPGNVRVIARSKQNISPIGSKPFEIRDLEGISVGPDGRVLFSARTQGSDDLVLLIEEEGSIRAIAHRGNGFVGETARPSTVNGNCSVAYRDDKLGNSIEFLFDYEQSFFIDDGSVVFSALLSGDCAWEGYYSLVQYRDGEYSTPTSVGQPIEGTINTTFFRPSELIGITPDNSLIVSTYVSRDRTVVHPGIGPNLSVARTLWEFSAVDAPKLIVSHGEALQTPNQVSNVSNDTIGFNVFDNLSFNNNGYYALTTRLKDEKAIFVGKAHQTLPYSDFNTPGDSVLEYRFGSKEMPPAPYTDSHFFTDLLPIGVLDDGRFLFFAKVLDAASSASSSGIKPGLWMADVDGTLTELVKPGQLLNSENGREVVIDGDFIWIDSIFDLTVLDDGDILFSVDYLLDSMIVRIDTGR